jgi:hypothetical protein
VGAGGPAGGVNMSCSSARAGKPWAGGGGGAGASGAPCVCGTAGRTLFKCVRSRARRRRVLGIARHRLDDRDGPYPKRKEGGARGGSKGGPAGGHRRSRRAPVERLAAGFLPTVFSLPAGVPPPPRTDGCCQPDHLTLPQPETGLPPLSLSVNDTCVHVCVACGVGRGVLASSFSQRGPHGIFAARR